MIMNDLGSALDTMVMTLNCLIYCNVPVLDNLVAYTENPTGGNVCVALTGAVDFRNLDIIDYEVLYEGPIDSCNTN